MGNPKFGNVALQKSDESETPKSNRPHTGYSEMFQGKRVLKNLQGTIVKGAGVLSSGALDAFGGQCVSLTRDHFTEFLWNSYTVIA